MPDDESETLGMYQGPRMLKSSSSEGGGHRGGDVNGLPKSISGPYHSCVKKPLRKSLRLAYIYIHGGRIGIGEREWLT
jgi:hypothetical protein